MPSGKQVLLSILQKYSQSSLEGSELAEATDTVQSALCLHCSTSSESMEQILQIAWMSQSEDGELVKQGLGVSGANVFLSDLFEEVIEDREIPKRVSDRFPNLTRKQYVVAMDMIWHILSSIQYWEQLSVVENGGLLNEQEQERLVNGARKKLQYYRTEPW